LLLLRWLLLLTMCCERRSFTIGTMLRPSRSQRELAMRDAHFFGKRIALLTVGGDIRRTCSR
jgi:hypothetical protein